MINYLTISEFINQYPSEKTFRVFRVSDGYLFKVKEIKETTIILNTKVHLEVLISTTDYLVHESSLGLDYSLPKIFRYCPESLDKPVQALNFRKELNTRLHNRKTWAFGRIIKEEFFPFGNDLKTPNYDDLIISITYDYEFDENTREAIYRLEKINWYNELDEISHSKPQPKLYENHEGMTEAYKRRKNIIDLLKHDIRSMSSGGGGSELLVSQLIGEINDTINLYISYGTFAIIDVITNSVNPILSAELAPSFTVRDLVISKLDFLSAEQSNSDLYKGSEL